MYQSPLRRLLGELKRRGILKVAAAYGAGAFVAIEGADLVFPRIGLGEGAVQAVVWLAIAGFPAALVVSWFYDLGPDGWKRAPGDVEGALETSPDARKSAGALWMGLGGTLLLALAVLLNPLGERDTPSGTLSETVVAILPFEVRAPADLSYLSDGLVDLLSTRMDGVGAIRTVPHRAVLGMVRQEGLDDPGELDPVDARRVAEALNAGRYVQGSVVEGAGRVSISASLVETSTNEPVAEATVEGEEGDLFGMVDALTLSLAAEIEDVSGRRLNEAAALTTDSLPALKAYFRGQDSLRAGQFTAALDAFVEARELDPTFALAHYRESLAIEWANQRGALEASDRAVEHIDRLSERDRQLVLAMNAWRHGEGERAADLYREILGTWPDDVEGWLQLAEIQNHYGPLRGGSIADSKGAFERVLRYEPQHLLSHWHLSRIDSFEDRLGDLDARIDLISSLSPEGDRTLELLAMSGAREGGTAWEEVVAAVAEAQDMTTRNALWNVAVFAEEPEKALDLAATIADSSRSGDVRATGHVLQATLLMALGRPQSAGDALDSVAVLDDGLALMYRTAFHLVPFREIDRARLTALVTRLEAWSPATGCVSSHRIRNYDPGSCMRPAVREYLLGLAEARLGRHDSARSRAASLRSWRRDGEVDRSHLLEMTHTVEAEIALARGDTASALVTLESAPGHIFYLSALNSLFYGHGHARFLRARLLEAVGRHEEAVRWYSSFDEISEFELIYHAVAQVRAGELLAALGGSAEAQERFANALEFLEDVQDLYSSWQARAQEGLRRTGP